MDAYFKTQSGIRTVVMNAQSSGTWEVAVDDRVYTVVVVHQNHARLILEIDGVRIRADLAENGRQKYIQLEGQAPTTFERVDSPREPRGASAGAENTLTADTPAQVVDVLVSEGDAVERGQALVILEAMKMEFRMTAPHAGVVKSVGCTPGEVVERGRVLIELE